MMKRAKSRYEKLPMPRVRDFSVLSPCRPTCSTRGAHQATSSFTLYFCRCRFTTRHWGQCPRTTGMMMSATRLEPAATERGCFGSTTHKMDSLPWMGSRLRWHKFGVERWASDMESFKESAVRDLVEDSFEKLSNHLQLFFLDLALFIIPSAYTGARMLLILLYADGMMKRAKFRYQKVPVPSVIIHNRDFSVLSLCTSTCPTRRAHQAVPASLHTYAAFPHTQTMRRPPLGTMPQNNWYDDECRDTRPRLQREVALGSSTHKMDMWDLQRHCFLEDVHCTDKSVHDVFLEFVASIPKSSMYYWHGGRNNAVRLLREPPPPNLAREFGLRAVVLEMNEGQERFSFWSGFSNVKALVLRNCKRVALSFEMPNHLC